jgi:tetratricopeptide (TPR) repeat protein
MSEARESPPGGRNRLDAARKLMESGDPETALADFRKSLPFAAENQLVLVHTLIALCCVSLGRLDEAMASYEAALSAARRAGDPEREAATLGSIGNVHEARQEHEAALSSYQQALGIYQVCDYTYGMATQLGNIAAVYWAMDDLEPSIRYILGALAIHDGHEPSLSHSFSGVTLDRLYRAMGKDRFVSVCVDYGLSRAAAELLAVRIEREPQLVSR